MSRIHAHPAAATTASLCVLLALAGCNGGASKLTGPRTDNPRRQAPTGTVVGPSVGVASASSGGARTVGEFASRGSGAGELAEPFGIAADSRNGDVYVVDSNNERVAKFTGSGHFLRAWGWGVADGRTHALQTCTKTCFAGFRGDGPGQLHFAEGIAVDNEPGSRSRGDTYVVDIENVRVDKFGPDGRFLLTFGGGVNKTARKQHDLADEDVCPVKRDDICGKGREGPTAGQLEFAVEGSLVAVGPSGNVYLGQRNGVKIFSPEGKYLSRIALTPPPSSSEGREAGGVSALAVDRLGNLYVVRHGVVGVRVYAPSGRLLCTLEPGGAPAYPEGPTPSLALDSSGNLFVDVYANERHRVDEYSPSCVRIASFDRGPRLPPGIADKEDGLPGIAYNSRTKLLYMVNADINVKPVVSRVRVLAPPRP